MGTENLPTPGLYIDDQMVNIYQDNINQLISDMGRIVTLFLPPTVSGCPNCLPGLDDTSQGIYDVTNPYPLGQYNKPFGPAMVCPVCFGTHEIRISKTAQYHALIAWSPKELKFGAVGKEFDANNVVKIKTQIVAFEDLRIAEKTSIDGFMCVRIMEIRKRGIRDLAFTESYWRVMDL